MQLGSLLSLLRESVLNDRSDRESGTSDYLWTDATLVTYLNEAQRKFAVDGLVIRDGSTDEVTKVTLAEGQDTYVLHEAVIAVVSARDESQQGDLRRIGHSVFGHQQQPTDGWWDPAALTALSPGRPVAFSTDEEASDQLADGRSQVVMRILPVPGADQDGTVLRLRVARRPLEQFTATGLSASPEIPEDHHIEMLDWAAYLALRIVDDDAGAPKRAAEFEARFNASVARARKLGLQRMFAPVGWGFGRGGFSWEH